MYDLKGNLIVSRFYRFIALAIRKASAENSRTSHYKQIHANYVKHIRESKMK